MLPEKWIGRIFDYMLALYGSKFSDLWKGTDPEAVRRVWAEKLAGFEHMPEAIKQALDALDDKPFPPTLPEFLSMCREAARRVGNATQALPHYPSEEEQERARQAAERAAQATRLRGGPSDPLGWAKALRTRYLAREHLPAVSVKAASDVLNEDWRDWKCERKASA